MPGSVSIADRFTCHFFPRQIVSIFPLTKRNFVTRKLPTTNALQNVSRVHRLIRLWWFLETADFHFGDTKPFLQKSFETRHALTWTWRAQLYKLQKYNLYTRSNYPSWTLAYDVHHTLFKSRVYTKIRKLLRAHVCLLSEFQYVRWNAGLTSKTLLITTAVPVIGGGVSLSMATVRYLAKGFPQTRTDPHCECSISTPGSLHTYDLLLLNGLRLEIPTPPIFSADRLLFPLSGRLRYWPPLCLYTWATAGQQYCDLFWRPKNVKNLKRFSIDYGSVRIACEVNI